MGEHTQEYLRTQANRNGENWEFEYIGEIFSGFIYNTNGEDKNVKIACEVAHGGYFFVTKIKLIRPLPPKHQFRVGDVFVDLVDKQHTVIQVSGAFIDASIKEEITDFGACECTRIIQPEVKELKLPDSIEERIMFSFSNHENGKMTRELVRQVARLALKAGKQEI